MNRAAKQLKLLSGPPCEKCGGATRLLEIRPHHRLRRRHIWSLECTACGTVDETEMTVPRQTH